MADNNKYLLEPLKGRINPIFFKKEITEKISTILENFDKKDLKASISNNGSHIVLSYPLKELSEKEPFLNDSIAVIEANNNEVSISTTSQTYSYRSEVRYGWMQKVGYEVFTQSNSLIIDENGTKNYESSFSDEANIEDPEGTRYKNTQELLKDTRPTFEKGILKDLPNTMSSPFSSHWKRYGKSNIFRKWGRTPIHGEYSDIGITFDGKKDDIKLVKESYGRLSYNGRPLNAKIEDLVKELDTLFKENYNKNTNGFDKSTFKWGLDQFQDSVNADFGV